VIAVVVEPSVADAQVSRPQLIDRAAALRHGLRRAWFAQVEVGGGRSRLVDVKFDGGTLFVQTGMATTYAIDGETGRTLWAAHVGAPNHPTLPLGIGANRLAVINGTMMYVLNRATGQVEFTQRIRGVPLHGAALTDQAVFVPTTTGQVETYSIVEEDHRNIANLRMEGRELTQPVVGYLGVAFGSSHGDLGVAESDGAGLLFRIPTNFPFVASPAARGDRIYAGNTGGMLYTIADASGREQWSFAAGAAINQPPVPFADAVYVLCEDLTMFRVSAETGREEWMAHGIRTFLAASPTRIYTLDSRGRLKVLSAKSGTVLDLVAMPPAAFPVTNSHTDQVFLATDTGFIQSLHEAEIVKRLDYRAPKQEPPPPKETPSTKTKSSKAKADTDAAPTPPAAAPAPAPAPAHTPMPPAEDPFGPPMPQAEKDADPFGAP